MSSTAPNCCNLKLANGYGCSLGAKRR